VAHAAVTVIPRLRRSFTFTMRRHLILLALPGLLAVLPAGVAAQARVAEYTRPIVLLVQPDSAELQRMRRRLGDDAFYVVADDAMWYRAEAIELLDSLRVPYATAVRAPLRFRVGGVMKEYTWGEGDAAWFALIYDGVSEPKVSFGVDLADEVRRLRPAPRPPPRAAPPAPSPRR
jgi:hypothetical protein